MARYDIGPWQTPIIVVTASDSFAFTITDASTLVPYLLLQPDGDLSVGNWTTELDATTNLYQSIDDDRTANDSDFIQSEVFPGTATLLTDLGDEISDSPL